LHLVTDLLAEQRPSEGAGDADAPLGEVGLVGAEDAVGDLLARVRVRELDGGPEGDLVAGELARVDDLGPGQLVLDLLDASFDERLPLACGVVLGVLAQVAVLAGGRDRLDDGGPRDALELTELVPKLGRTFRGDGVLLHRWGADLARERGWAEPA